MLTAILADIPPSRMSKLPKWLPAAGVIVCLVLLGPGLILTFRGITDFIDLYGGAKLTFTGDQYNVARILATEAHFTGYSSPTRLFMRLPVFGLLLWPIVQIPYVWASCLWEALCFAAIAGFSAIWPANRDWVIAACCWSLPIWMTLAEGQDTAFLLLWLALACLALRRRHPVACGLVLSLCAAKYHLFLLLPLWVIGNRLRGVAVGLLLGGVALIAGSFIAGGSHWPRHYIELLREPANSPYAELMPNLHSVFMNAPYVQAAATVVVALLAWFAIRKLDVLGGLSPVLLGGILIGPHDYMADCALVVPAVLLLLQRFERASMRNLLLFLLTPVPYVAVMLHAGWIVIVPVIALLTILVFDRRSAPAILLQSEQYPSGAEHSQA